MESHEEFCYTCPDCFNQYDMPGLVWHSTDASKEPKPCQNPCHELAFPLLQTVAEYPSLQ